MTRTLWITRRAFGARLLASGAQVGGSLEPDTVADLRGPARHSANTGAPSYPQGHDSRKRLHS